MKSHELNAQSVEKMKTRKYWFVKYVMWESIKAAIWYINNVKNLCVIDAHFAKNREKIAIKYFAYFAGLQKEPWSNASQNGRMWYVFDGSKSFKHLQILVI